MKLKFNLTFIGLIVFSFLISNCSFCQDEFSNYKDYGLYSYVKKEYEFNKENRIKTKKYEYMKEYINSEGEIEKMEYFSDDGVWSTLYFEKANDRIYYNEKEGLFGIIDDYMEIDSRLMVTGQYPLEQTTVWIQYVFNYNGQIDLEILTDEGSKRNMGVYLYNQVNKIDKIYNYVFLYKNDNSELEYFKKEPEINSLMLLSSIETFKYDDTGKLMSIEKSNIQDKKTETVNIEYNERGHIINDYYKGIVEYEYYE